MVFRRTARSLGRRKQFGPGAVWEGVRGGLEVSGSAQDISKSCGCGVGGLKFAGAGRERTKNSNPLRTLPYIHSVLAMPS